MKIKKLIVLSVFSVSLFFVSCSKDSINPAGIPIVLPQQGAEVVSSQNSFALNFFKELLSQDPTSGNIIISPLSIYLDFSMMYNGAAGKSADEMQQAFQMNNIPVSLLNNVNKALIKGLPKADPAVQVQIANSIWYRNTGPQPLTGFLDTVSDSYLAEIAGVNFDNPSTVNKINSWVSDKTGKKIKEVLETIDPSEIIFLINAAYFKGDWKLKFDKNNTRDRTFFTDNNIPVQAPFMAQTDVFNYFENERMQCMEIPYGSGNFNMNVILPAEGITISDVLDSFDGNIMRDISSSMDSVTVTLFMPKWTTTYKIDDLRPPLSALGMNEVFGAGKADLSKMYPGNAGVFISKALHKAYISVDENGTVAAAVTAISGATTSVPKTFEMDLDRPFVYFITEKNTGTILFMGEVNDPTAK